MNTVSVKVSPSDSRQLGVAIDGDWDQQEIEKAFPDQLGFAPRLPGGCKVIEPTKVYLWKGGKRRVFHVTGFKIEPDDASYAVLRHFQLGSEIHD